MEQNIKSHFNAQNAANQNKLQSVMAKLDRIKNLVKTKGQPKSAKATSAKSEDCSLDVTEDMLNMFVRLEVQRRYFNVVGIEMLSKQFGMKVPSSINETMNRMTKIPLANLITIGRNLTLEQYFEIKTDFEADPKAKAQMIKDRQTYIVYKDDPSDDERLRDDAPISDSSETPVKPKKKSARDSPKRGRKSSDESGKAPRRSRDDSSSEKPPKKQVKAIDKQPAKQLSQSSLARFMPTAQRLSTAVKSENPEPQKNAWSLLLGEGQKK